MRRQELDYHLPPERIAQHPVEPRDAARLLVLHRATERIEHRVFREIGEYVRRGDCLVCNDTRVIPARFFCRRASGGRVEALFLRRERDVWRVLLGSSARLRVSETLRCGDDSVELTLVERHERGEWSVQPAAPIDPLDLLARVGQTPLPPYIQREPPDPADARRYQTVYATRPGAVAAPTAGLHFTPAVLERLRESGVRQVFLTLHVGRGTFAPIEAEDLAQHRMHAEWFELPPATLAALHETRRAGGRIVAVGTTSARALESLPITLGSAREPPRAELDGREPVAGWTDIFIHPPYCFRNVDALITNFHLPRSTLLALVMAFAGIEATWAAYRAAIQNGYRFYSYGDVMLITE